MSPFVKFCYVQYQDMSLDMLLFYPVNLLRGSNSLSSQPKISYLNLSKLLHLSKLLSLYLQNSDDNLIKLLKRLNQKMLSSLCLYLVYSKLKYFNFILIFINTFTLKVVVNLQKGLSFYSLIAVLDYINGVIKQFEKWRDCGIFEIIREFLTLCIFQ